MSFILVCLIVFNQLSISDLVSFGLGYCCGSLSITDHGSAPCLVITHGMTCCPLCSAFIHLVVVGMVATEASNPEQNCYGVHDAFSLWTDLVSDEHILCWGWLGL